MTLVPCSQGSNPPAARRAAGGPLRGLSRAGTATQT
jgi:hypothetical protein